MKRGNTLLVMSFLATVLLLSGCNGGGDTSPASAGNPAGSSTTNTTGASAQVTVNGTFGTDYAFYKKKWHDIFSPSAAIAAFGAISKAIAVPVFDEWVDWENSVELTIQNDGSFSVGLQKTFDFGNETYGPVWVLVVERTNGQINFVTVPDSDSETIVGIPISSLNSALGLGTISNLADEAQSGIDAATLSQQSTLDASVLSQLAANDDILKGVVNSYNNVYGKDPNKIIFDKFHVVTSGNYADISSQYALADSFQGYSFHIHGESGSTLSTNFAGICSGANELALVPPATGSVTANGITYDINNPLLVTAGPVNNRTDGGQECAGGISYVRKDADGRTTVNFITGDTAAVLGATKPVPAGNFSLQFDGNEIGKYNFAYALPVFQSGQMKVPTPSVKLDIQQDSEVKGLWLKWNIYDKQAASWAEANPDSIKHIVSSFNVHMDDFNGISADTSRLEIACNGPDITTGYLDLSTCDYHQPIYYNYGAEDRYSLDDVNVVLNFVGTEYRFAYRRN